MRPKKQRQDPKKEKKEDQEGWERVSPSGGHGCPGTAVAFGCGPRLVRLGVE